MSNRQKKQKPRHNPKSSSRTTADLDKLVARLVNTKLSAAIQKGYKGKGLYTAGATYTGHGAYNLKALRRGAMGSLKTVGRVALGAAKNEARMAMANGGYAGLGSYSDTTVTNELINSAGGHVKTVPMSFRTKRHDETDILEIRCREYITDVIGPTVPFNVQTYDLNPGLLNFCPKLAQIAANFDRHRLTEMVVIYHSTTTDIGSSTNGQCGVVIIGGSPNVLIPEYTSKRAMLDAKGAVSAKTTENCVYGFECDPSKGGKMDWQYVRYQPVLVGQDQKMYDAGCIQVAVSNSPSGFANQQLGELYIEYTWELSDANLRTGLGWCIPRDFFVGPTVGATAIGTNLFGGTAGLVYYSMQNSMGTLLTPTAGGFTLTFPNEFEGAISLAICVQALVNVTSSNLVAPSLAISGNFARIADVYGANGNPSYFEASAPVVVGTTGNVSLDVHLYVTPAAQGTNNVLTITGNGGASFVRTSVDVSQYNSMGLVEATSGVNTAPPTLVNSLTGVAVSGTGI